MTTKKIIAVFLQDAMFKDKWQDVFAEILDRNTTAEFDTWQNQVTSSSLTHRRLYQKLIEYAISQHGEIRMLSLLKSTLKKSNCLQIYRKCRFLLLIYDCIRIYKIHKCKIITCINYLLFMTDAIKTYHGHGEYWFNIKSGIDQFYGRDKQIRKLLEIYDKHTSFVVVILCGLPGMGKTELVAQFLRNEQINHKVPCIWISLLNFKEELTNLAETFLPDSKLDFKNTDPGSLLVTIAIDIGKIIDQKWILVLDGCTAATVKPKILMNLADSKAMVILTSSNKNLYHIHRSHLIDVTELDEESALNYVKCTLMSEETEASMRLLCQFVNNYPLALEQATWYLLYKQTHNVSKQTIHAYIEECKAKSATLLSIQLHQFGRSKYEKTILETLATTINQLQSSSEDNNKHQYAFNLLQIIACLGPDHVETTFLLKVFTCWKETVDEKVFQESLNFLSSLCLIKSEKNECLQMNPIVQQVVRCIKRIDNKMLYDILINLEIGCQSVPEIRHFLFVWEHSLKEMSISEELMLVALKISGRLDKLFMYNEGLCFAESVIKSINEAENNPLNPELLLEMKINCGLALRRLGKGNEAVKLFKGINNTYTLPSEQPNEKCFTILQHLANSYYNVQKFEKALKLYKEVCAGKSLIFGEDSIEVNKCQSNIAGALSDLKQFSDAEVKLQGVLNWFKEKGYQDEVLRVTHSLGYCYYKMKDYSKAKVQFEHVIKKRADHQDNQARELIAKYMLARAIFHLGEIYSAIDMLKDVYQKQAGLIGEDHPDTIDTKNKIEKYLVCKKLHNFKCR